MGDQPASSSSTLPEGTLNPFFGRLTVGLAIPFALLNGMHAFVAHGLPNPVSAGTVYLGQIASYLGTLLVLSLGLAAFHKTNSKYLKVGGGFLFLAGLGMLMFLCMSL